MELALSDIRMRDPFLLDAGAGGYYLFGTTDENLWGGPGTGFDCYRSMNLTSWQGPFPAFRPASGFWGTTQFWAPEVHAHDGWFAMLATFADQVTSVAREVGVEGKLAYESPDVTDNQGNTGDARRPIGWDDFSQSVRSPVGVGGRPTTTTR